MVAAADCWKIDDDYVQCPRLVLDLWQAETLDLEEQVVDLEEQLAISEAARLRAEGEVLLLERRASEPRPYRPLLPLVPLGLAVGGGACIAAEGCPPVAGWVTVGVAVLLGLVGR